jgi:hypothetical protein
MYYNTSRRGAQTATSSVFLSISSSRAFYNFALSGLLEANREAQATVVKVNMAITAILKAHPNSSINPKKFN